MRDIVTASNKQVLEKMVKACWKPSVESDGSVSGRLDGLLWHMDLGHHDHGEFSMAVIQANSLLEDQSQLESGPLTSNATGPRGTFVGVYDGHGGTEASRFVNDTLLRNLKSNLSSSAHYYLFNLTDILFLMVLFILLRIGWQLYKKKGNWIYNHDQQLSPHQRQFIFFEP